jgi:23S rRNA pseudouridine955/2504/2580 synthase
VSRVQTIEVSEDEAGMRIDRWFKAHFPHVTHGQLEKYLRKGEVRIDGGRAKSNRRLEPGETVRVPPLPDNARPQRTAAHATDRAALAAMTIFEDDDVLALNKPFGLAVQGGTKTARHIDGMFAALGEGAARPKLVHRLDKDTGGLLLAAKNRAAAQKLTDAFKRREVEKTYWALVAGAPRPREGTIDLPIAKQTTGVGERVAPAEGEFAKRAISHFQTMDEAGPVTFLAMRPVTGRTHQLRVHAAAIGAPVVGDGKYGGAAARIDGVSPKLHLSCRAMRFRHPKTGHAMTLTAPLSGHMAETWKFFGFDADAQAEWPETL